MVEVIAILSILILLLLKVPVAGIIALSIPYSPELRIGAIEQGIRLEDLIVLGVFLQLLISRKKLRFPRVLVPFWLAMLSAIASTCFALLRGSLDPVRAILYILKEVEMLFIAFAVCAITDTDEKRSRTVRISLLAVSIAGILSIWQLVTGTFWGLAGRRASLPFDQGPFPLGGYALAMIPLATAMVATRQGRPMAVAALVLAICAVILSGSRSSIIGAVISVIVVLLLLSRGSLLGRFWALAGAGLVIVGALWMMSWSGMLVRFAGLFSPAVGQQEIAVSFAARREIMWPVYMHAFRKFPLMGNGIGAVVSDGSTRLPFADNYYVLTLGERGLIGAILLGSAHCIWGVSLFRTAERLGPKDGAVLIAAIGATVGFLVASIGTDAFRVIRPAEAYWYLQGLAASYAMSAAPVDQEGVPE